MFSHSAPLLGPTSLGKGVMMLGAERAFRADEQAPALDKVYFSFARADKDAWDPVALPGTLARSAETALRRLLGPMVGGLAVYLAQAAGCGVPVRLIQAHLPWNGGACERIKIYHQAGPTPGCRPDAEQTHARMARLGAFVPPLDLGGPAELYGVLWPQRKVIEAYSLVPTLAGLNADLRKELERSGARLGQDAIDDEGVRTWYFDIPDLSIPHALSILSSLTPFSPEAQERLTRQAQAGWQWGTLVIQHHPAKGLVPIADIIHPLPGGLSFSI